MSTLLTCPVCQGHMREHNKDGILIDSCTQCKGIWLDRGELEKLLAFARQDEPAYEAAPRHAAPPSYNDYPQHRDSPPRDPYREQRYDHDDRRYDRGHDSHPSKRKKSRLEYLFDLFD